MHIRRGFWIRWSAGLLVLVGVADVWLFPISAHAALMQDGAQTPPVISSLIINLKPGSPVPDLNNRVAPLNVDVLTQLFLQGKLTAIFQGFIGSVDSTGGATGTFEIPKGPFFANRQVCFVGLILDAGFVTVLDFTNPACVFVQ